MLCPPCPCPHTVLPKPQCKKTSSCAGSLLQISAHDADRGSIIMMSTWTWWHQSDVNLNLTSRGGRNRKLQALRRNLWTSSIQKCPSQKSHKSSPWLRALHCLPAMRRHVLFVGVFFEEESHVGVASYYLWLVSYFHGVCTLQCVYPVLMRCLPRTQQRRAKSLPARICYECCTWSECLTSFFAFFMLCRWHHHVE